MRTQHERRGDAGDREEPVTSNRLIACAAAWVAALPCSLRWLLSGLLLAGTGVLDIVTGGEIGLSILYLLPVLFAGVLISRSAGAALSFAGAATWWYAEAVTGATYSAAWIPYWNTGVRLGFFLLVNELVVHLRRAHAQQRALAREDALTGIANARVLEEHVHRAIAVSRRTGRAFTLAYVDIDRFKRVNDTHGHAEGDQLLRTVARRLAAEVRPSDTVARLGGDEFGILMPDTEAPQARASLERVSRALADAVRGRWAVDATIGAVTFTRPPEGVSAAVREADALMYRGKGEGRGRILQATWP